MIVIASAVLLAVVIILLVIFVDRRTAPDLMVPRPTIPGWAAMVFGILAVAAVVYPLVASRVAPSGDQGTVRNVQLLPLAAIAFSIVGVVLGGYAIRRGDRHWPTWVGLVTGGLALAFWLFFVAGELLFPH